MPSYLNLLLCLHRCGALGFYEGALRFGVLHGASTGGQKEQIKTLENGKWIDMAFEHGLYDTGLSETCLSIIKFMK